MSTVRLSYKEASFRRVWQAYKSRAKTKGLLWDLTPDQTRLLLTSACWYCGAGPQRVITLPGRFMCQAALPDEERFICNGLDRIDNTAAYGLSNVFPCCQACNMMKGTMPFEVFLQHVSDIHRHVTSKKRLPCLN